MMFSAGAAAPTQGPFIEKLLGSPFSAIPPTVSTSGEYHAGLTIVCTCFQPRGSAGIAASCGGFLQHSLPVVPAPAMMYAPLTLTAQLLAAPRPHLFVGRVTFLQAASLLV